MSWLRKLGAVFLFVTLEMGALFGVPIPPEKIREITDLMHRPRATQVMRDDTEEPETK